MSVPISTFVRVSVSHPTGTGGGGETPSTNAVLSEEGDNLILESGEKMIQEG